MKLSYMSGDVITRTLNEAFGFDGWCLEVKSTTREVRWFVLVVLLLPVAVYCWFVVGLLRTVFLQCSFFGSFAHLLTAFHSIYRNHPKMKRADTTLPTLPQFASLIVVRACIEVCLNCSSPSLSIKL